MKKNQLKYNFRHSLNKTEQLIILKCGGKIFLNIELNLIRTVFVLKKKYFIEAPIKIIFRY